MGDINGNQGTVFAVQSLWSNNAAVGAGYCAGAGTDLPTGYPIRVSGSVARSAGRVPSGRRLERW